MVAIDPRNGDIRALTGGRAVRARNLQSRAARAPPARLGVQAVRVCGGDGGGYTPSSEVDDDPIDVDPGTDDVWSPANYDDDYSGRITFRSALIKSANAATVRVSQAVGIPRVIDTGAQERNRQPAARTFRPSRSARSRSRRSSS